MRKMRCGHRQEGRGHTGADEKEAVALASIDEEEEEVMQPPR